MTRKILALNTPEAEVQADVAVLCVVGSSFVVRYFEVRAANPLAAAPLDALTTLQDTGTADLVFAEGEVFYTAAAFPEKEFPDGTLFVETAQHWIGPSVAQVGLLGYGEMYDFAALVAPVTMGCKPTFMYNYFAQGSVVKGTVRRIGRLQNTFAHLTFIAAKISDPISQWTVVRGVVPCLAFIDRTVGSWETAPAGFSVLDLLPSVEVTTPTAVASGSYADVVVQTKNKDGTSYPYTGELVVDAISGYTTKSRVTMVNGQGSLRVMPLGLDVGDTVRVKINTRTISGMADVSIPVA